MLSAGDAAAVATFVDLGYDEKIIKEIIAVLDQGSTSLHGTHIPTTASSSYGPSGPGVELARNVDLAHQHVVDAIRDMAAGLKGFRDSVDMFHLQTQATDQDTHAALTRIRQATDCSAQRTLASPSQCSLPGASGSDA